VLTIVYLFIALILNMFVFYLCWLRRWRPYNPEWLVQLAKKQYKSDPWLAEALHKCTCTRFEGDFYIRFVDAKNANKPDSKWQFRENLILEDDVHGDLVLDILENGTIGGIEFVSRLLR
jgi:uncharacterized protein YuzE